jgi:hypothetical protein
MFDELAPKKEVIAMPIYRRLAYRISQRNAKNAYAITLGFVHPESVRAQSMQAHCYRRRQQYDSSIFLTYSRG